MPEAELIIRVVFTVLILGVMAWMLFRMRRSMKSIYESASVIHDRVGKLLEERAKLQSKGIEQIIKEKKRKLTNVTSISFHFVDKDEVVSFYNDTFREPTVESLVSEVIGEKTAEIKGTVPQILESKVGGKDLKKWISTIKLPDTSLPAMFARYQKQAIETGEVILGLEELDIELNELQQFVRAVENMHKQFDLTIDETLVESHCALLKQKAAESMLEKLEAATGWVLVEGRFKITEEDDTYRCTYTHPVNEYLPDETGPVTISFTLARQLIQPRYATNYGRAAGSLIPLRLYGKVWLPIDRSTRSWNLEITPLAVY